MKADVHLHGYGDQVVELTDELLGRPGDQVVVFLDRRAFTCLSLEREYPGYVLTIGTQRLPALASRVLLEKVLTDDVLYPQEPMGDELLRLAMAYEMLRRAKAAGYRVG